jgi:hypothetical protein
MKRTILFPAAAGAVALIVWTFLLNVLFGLEARFAMKPVPHEREVYDVLKSAVTEPGRYLCNPALTADGTFPDGEPVFGINHSGVGHESALVGEVVGILEFLIIPLIGAWLMSITSGQFRGRFVNRMGFFLIIGVVVAIAGDLHGFGIGGSPVSLALIFAARTTVTWMVLGLAIAATTRPDDVRAGSA